MHRHVSALLNPGLFDIQRRIAVVVEAMRAAWILREGNRGDHEAEGKRSDEHGVFLLAYFTAMLAGPGLKPVIQRLTLTRP
jgi:hypothetical protein